MDVILEITYYNPGCPQLSLKKTLYQTKKPKQQQKTSKFLQ